MAACAVRTAAVLMPSRWMACGVRLSCLTAEPGMDLTVAGGGSSWALATLQPVSRATAAAAEAREAGLLLSMTVPFGSSRRRQPGVVPATGRGVTSGARGREPG